MGIKGPAAALALVAPSPRVPAVWADALYVTVGQETVAIGAIGQKGVVCIYESLIQQLTEYLLDHFPVVIGAGGGE